MQQLFKSKRSRPRRRPLLRPSELNRNLKITKRKWPSVIKIIKLLAAILVPLMIGIFTVVTTMQESKTARLQRETEMRQRAIDALKTKEQQERDDIRANEIRIQNIYDTFMKEMSSIVLKDNINLTIPEILFTRSKTLLTLEQIDTKRKWYLIKFLYDSQLLYTNTFGMRYIDLAGVDLSNVKFGVSKKSIAR